MTPADLERAKRERAESERRRGIATGRPYPGMPVPEPDRQFTPGESSAAAAAVIAGLGDPLPTGSVIAKTLASPPPDGCSEEEFLQAVLSLFRGHGWKTYHTRTSRKSDPGFPDLVVGRESVVIIAELKVGDNQASKDQADWLRLFTSSGLMSVLWRPADWPIIVRTAEILK